MEHKGTDGEPGWEGRYHTHKLGPRREKGIWEDNNELVWGHIDFGVLVGPPKRITQLWGGSVGIEPGGTSVLRCRLGNALLWEGRV